MMLYARGSANDRLSNSDLRYGLVTACTKLGVRNKVLVIPPDFSRFHSRAGELTQHAWAYYGKGTKEGMTILPALGTHTPVTPEERSEMFGDIPEQAFRVHDWRNSLVTIGDVPGEYVNQISGGLLNYSWPAQVNRLLVEGGYDHILSIGQVVPHEVIGMANHAKNLFVGTGGKEGIDKSHFLGAVWGMERILGRAENPVRKLFDYAMVHFAAQKLPTLVFVQTVVGRDTDGSLVTRGLYISEDRECFERAAELSRQVNIELMQEPIRKAVVYLDPKEFKSTWIGNKAIYRTRMALADNGELIILAPGVRMFAEAEHIDPLIRKYGYKGTPEILGRTIPGSDLYANMSAAAHLIHGSSEGRFRITYCPGGLSQHEIESVGFEYGDLAAMTERYDPSKLSNGYNRMPDGEQIFYVSNPAIGLWAAKDKFQQ